MLFRSSTFSVMNYKQPEVTFSQTFKQSLASSVASLPPRNDLVVSSSQAEASGSTSNACATIADSGSSDSIEQVQQTEEPPLVPVGNGCGLSAPPSVSPETDANAQLTIEVKKAVEELRSLSSLPMAELQAKLERPPEIGRAHV